MNLKISLILILLSVPINAWAQSKHYILFGGEDGKDPNNQFFRDFILNYQSFDSTWNKSVYYDGSEARSPDFLSKAKVRPEEWSVDVLGKKIQKNPNDIQKATKENLIKSLQDLKGKTPGQVIIQFKTHGSSGSGHAWSADGGMISAKDPDLQAALAELKSRGWKIGIIDNSCYSGESISPLSEYGCVMSSQGKGAEACTHGSWNFLDPVRLASNSDRTRLSKLDQNSSMTMEKLFLHHLLNGPPVQEFCQEQPQMSGFEMNDLTLLPSMLVVPDVYNSKIRNDWVNCKTPTDPFLSLKQWADDVSKVINKTDKDRYLEYEKPIPAYFVKSVAHEFESLFGIRVDPEKISTRFKNNLNNRQQSIIKFDELAMKEKSIVQQIQSFYPVKNARVSLPSTSIFSGYSFQLINLIQTCFTAKKSQADQYGSEFSEIRLKDLSLNSEDEILDYWTTVGIEKIESRSDEKFIHSLRTEAGKNELRSILKKIYYPMSQENRIQIQTEERKLLELRASLNLQEKNTYSSLEAQTEASEITQDAKKLRFLNYMQERRRLKETPIDQLSVEDRKRRENLEICSEIKFD